MIATERQTNACCDLSSGTATRCHLPRCVLDSTASASRPHADAARAALAAIFASLLPHAFTPVRVVVAWLLHLFLVLLLLRRLKLAVFGRKFARFRSHDLVRCLGVGCVECTATSYRASGLRCTFGLERR